MNKNLHQSNLCKIRLQLTAAVYTLKIYKNTLPFCHVLWFSIILKNLPHLIPLPRCHSGVGTSKGQSRGSGGWSCVSVDSPARGPRSSKRPPFGTLSFSKGFCEQIQLWPVLWQLDTIWYNEGSKKKAMKRKNNGKWEKVAKSKKTFETGGETVLRCLKIWRMSETCARMEPSHCAKLASFATVSFTFRLAKTCCKQGTFFFCCNRTLKGVGSNLSAGPKRLETCEILWVFIVLATFGPLLGLGEWLKKCEQVSVKIQ